MPGRATDISFDGRNTITPAVPPYENYRHSVMTPADRYSDPGNPFLDSETPARYPSGGSDHPAQKPTDAVAAFAIAVKEHRAASCNSPAVADHKAGQSVTRYGAWPSPMSSTGDSGLKSRRSILSEITSAAYTDDDFSDKLYHQPLSNFNLRSKHSLRNVRETMYTESWRDPFEHDLLLQVDTCTETPDSMAVLAYPTTNKQPARSVTPLKARSNNPWQSSMVSPTSGSVLPPIVATHRGWDDIKRYSIERVVPSMPSLNTLQETPISSLRKKTSSLYL
jgi:hypothetical protein